MWSVTKYGKIFVIFCLWVIENYVESTSMKNYAILTQLQSLIFLFPILSVAALLQTHPFVASLAASAYFLPLPLFFRVLVFSFLPRFGQAPANAPNNKEPLQYSPTTASCAAHACRIGSGDSNDIPQIVDDILGCLSYERFFSNFICKWSEKLFRHFPKRTNTFLGFLLSLTKVLKTIFAC